MNHCHSTKIPNIYGLWMLQVNRYRLPLMSDVSNVTIDFALDIPRVSQYNTSAILVSNFLVSAPWTCLFLTLWLSGHWSQWAYLIINHKLNCYLSVDTFQMETTSTHNTPTTPYSPYPDHPLPTLGSISISTFSSTMWWYINEHWPLLCVWPVSELRTDPLPYFCHAVTRHHSVRPLVPLVST